MIIELRQHKTFSGVPQNPNMAFTSGQSGPESGDSASTRGSPDVRRSLIEARWLSNMEVVIHSQRWIDSAYLGEFDLWGLSKLIKVTHR